MGGSQMYWGGEFDVLSQRARLVAVDLFGFGESPKPAFGYGPRQHTDAVAACFRELGIDEPAVLSFNGACSWCGVAVGARFQLLLSSQIHSGPMRVQLANRSAAG